MKSEHEPTTFGCPYYYEYRFTEFSSKKKFEDAGIAALHAAAPDLFKASKDLLEMLDREEFRAIFTYTDAARVFTLLKCLNPLMPLIKQNHETIH